MVSIFFSLVSESLAHLLNWMGLLNLFRLVKNFGLLHIACCHALETLT